MAGFLVEFRAQAAQVLGGGGGSVGGSGDAFAGAFFVVESVRSMINGCAADEEGRGRTSCHAAFASAQCIWGG